MEEQYYNIERRTAIKEEATEKNSKNRRQAMRKVLSEKIKSASMEGLLEGVTTNAPKEVAIDLIRPFKDHPLRCWMMRRWRLLSRAFCNKESLLW